MVRRLQPSLTGVRGLCSQITLRAHVSATEVKERIEQALCHSAASAVRRITVGVSGEKVTLTGHVPSWMDREEAGCAAWDPPGVRTVENRITATV